LLIYGPGRLEPGSHAIEFEFANLVKEHESYYGRYGEREREREREKSQMWSRNMKAMVATVRERKERLIKGEKKLNFVKEHEIHN